jgi:hypothetical protein
MSPTEVVQPHGEPTHPLVIARHFGEGQGLSHLALVAQPTGAVVPFHDTCVHLLVAERGEHMFKTCFALHRSYLYSCHPTAFVAFLDLAVGQALSPADHRTTPLALGRVTAAEHLQKRRLVAGIGIGENGGQMPLTQTVFRVLDSGQRLIIGTVAHH